MAEKSWKVAWITGASGAICGELAQRLAASGVKIAATARPSERLTELAEAHANITAYPADMRDPAELKRCVEKIEAELGPIDLMIAGAGMYEPFDVHAIDLEGFADTMELNVTGLMNTIAAVLPAMLARRSGHVTLMGSLFGYSGWPGNGGYGASKAAVINLAESLKLELKGTGVDLTLVSPGFVNTNLNASYKGKKHFVMSPQRCAKQILKRLDRRPYEIAFPIQVALFLKFARAMPHAIGFAMIRAFIKAMG
ncbi:SDR family NAD(P)-dependent oxidoreductase [Methyloligella sp. 2.7D]|uniref:SDR family NAD(P)-dependent oxidoreductase n=1 Tax=unclassified Methyloligella TaxID=2625955 RepID=UPI00157D9C72|nr:SDR family NAD(P)-dependent oxidoreductase [Methyloligella sp. GL2]QKP76846.1 SDR family NAD(P)-dependent oxidoreductase [Methyloligella sp. GL2]